jgi:hypothetical protein
MTTRADAVLSHFEPTSYPFVNLNGAESPVLVGEGLTFQLLERASGE